MRPERSRTQTILMVEDNLDHAELIRRTLQSNELWCELIHVTDGDSALEYLLGTSEDSGHDTFPPDLILLDIRLPRRNGMDVLRAIRERPSLTHIPVVILTTSANVEDVREAYRLHVNSYLVKPFGFPEFRALLEEMGIYWLYRNKSAGSLPDR